MKSLLLGLGLILGVSFLDVGQVWTLARAADIQAAQAAAKKQDHQKVIELLSPQVEKLSRDGLMLLANAYSAIGNHEAAIKTYTACLAINARDYEAKALIGSEQVDLGKDKEALATLKEALEFNPNFAMTYKILIRYYEKKQNKYELRLLYEDMNENLGETVEAITKLCELTTMDRLYDLAFKYCQRGIVLSPQTPENFIYLGISAKETGQPEKAEENLKKAAEDFPKSELAQLSYAKHLDEKKNFIGSYSYYKKALAAKADSIPGLVGFGNSSFEIQKYAESLDAFSKACKLDRKTLPPFRRVTNSLRTMKIQDWLKKFETGVEACGG
jgi:tetratricopeptide (TPR) repeat protein